MSVSPTTSPPHAADRLLNAVDRVGAPVCVGLDPVVTRLPDALKPASDDEAAAVQSITTFTRSVLEAVATHVPCVKFQSACFERYHWRGQQALEQLMHDAEQLGLEVILDAKRGDIGISAAHYAVAAFAHETPRWLTINAYLGADTLEPFLKPGRGAFALVRTSNPGSDALQGLSLADGRSVAEAVADMVAETGAKFVGERGYSALGAVVGATKREDAARLRQRMPQQLFLVPGFGAQGGSVEDIKACFRDGSGAIITASRSVIFAFEPSDVHWERAIGEAAASFADQVGSAAGMR